MKLYRKWRAARIAKDLERQFQRELEAEMRRATEAWLLRMETHYLSGLADVCKGPLP